MSLHVFVCVNKRQPTSVKFISHHHHNRPKAALPVSHRMLDLVGAFYLAGGLRSECSNPPR